MACLNIFFMCLWDVQQRPQEAIRNLGAKCGRDTWGAYWGRVNIEVVTEAGASLKWPRNNQQDEKIKGWMRTEP